MKTALIILSLLIGAFMILCFFLGGISRSGKVPGLVAGSLSGCPDKPNCVCSEQTDDASHYIDPVIIPLNVMPDPMPVLEKTIRDMGGSIQAENENYLAATFSSTIFGFVDDLELRIDPAQKVIHIRSASRVGYSDAGVNRKRTALLRKTFHSNVVEADQSLKVIPAQGN
jgi:uncharacterized protein (DUF1499 family)